MNTEKFSFETLNGLNYNDQKNYINKFFIPLTNGSHCLLENGKYTIVADDVMKKVYLNRLDAKLKNYYTKENTSIKNVVYQLNKPQLYEDKVNLCPQLPTPKPYKEFDDETKKCVELFLDYINEVLASNNKDVFKYIIKWSSYMCKGNKNTSALVFKTNAEGVGKSTYPVFLRQYVLGPDLSLEDGSEPLKSKFNGILGGKLFVYFEELETFGASEWMAVSSVLKRQITSNTYCLQNKNQDAYTVENINNYMLLSNHDIEDGGRRFFVADISTHRKGDRKYWDNLYSKCFNKKVGYAFYCYLCEQDTTNFNSQDFPITVNKLNSVSKRLDPVYLFLKEQYLLKNKSINSKLSDFYEEYTCWCLENSKRKCQKTDFTQKLKEIQIVFYKTNGFNTYKVDILELRKTADKNKWLNELDEFENEGETEINPIDDGIDDTSEIKKLLERIKQLEEENKQLRETQTKPKKNKSKVKKEDIEDLEELERELLGTK